MTAIRDKSIALTQLFIDLVEQRCGGRDLTLASPRAAAKRGSQGLSPIHTRLRDHAGVIARRVIGDFRAPDLLRFGFTRCTRVSSTYGTPSIGCATSSRAASGATRVSAFAAVT